MPRMLDLFCGRFGWGRVFAERGWEVVGIDLVRPDRIPEGCTFIQGDILTLSSFWFDKGIGFYLAGEPLGQFDFACASSPCEEFSLFGLKHFHPTPPYPDIGIKLFSHTHSVLEESRISYVMENVRSARQFVGDAVNHCGPFYLWGNSVPPLMPQRIKKGVSMGSGSRIKGMTKEEKWAYRKQFDCLQVGGRSKERQKYTAKWATIPTELATVVCDYAEGLLIRKRLLHDP